MLSQKRTKITNQELKLLKKNEPSLNLKQRMNTVLKNQFTAWSSHFLISCFLCGGENCKAEDWTQCQDTPIKGLNCNLIGSSIFASQRPSTVLIEKFDLVNELKK